MSSPLTLRCLPARDVFSIHHNGERFTRDLVQPIMALGYDEKTAAHYARLIAKNPCRDENGKIAVVEDGFDLKVLAILDLDLFPNRVIGIITALDSSPASPLPIGGSPAASFRQ